MSIFPQFRFNFIKQDLSAGFVVFLVALPLCLGIALASGAPPMAGLITGMIAGLLVSVLSGSEMSVSGPAAGLTITVIAAQESIGAFEGLLVATILSGVFQIALGTIRAGLLAAFFPSSVIKGMLAGIGIIISFKQLPHIVGWMSPFEAALTPAFTASISSFLSHIHALALQPLSSQLSRSTCSLCGSD